MSRRRNTHRDHPAAAPTCSWCVTRPTRDGLLVCDQCLDGFAAGLRDLLPTQSDRPLFVGLVRYAGTGPSRVEWCPFPRPTETVPGLWDDLLASVAGERAIDYATLGSSASGSGERGVASTGINLPERAVEIEAEVARSLRHLVVVCRDLRVQHAAPAELSLSSRLVPAMVEWLRWRVDGIAAVPEAATAAARVRDAIDAARWVVNRPPVRQQLGPCLVEGCPGQVTAVPGAAYARCDGEEGHAFDAQPFRDWLLGEADELLCTAAEIANGIAAWLNRRDECEQIRKRVNQWVHRGQLTVRGTDPDTGGPRFRFGDAKALLIASEQRRPRTSRSTSTNQSSKGA